MNRLIKYIQAESTRYSMADIKYDNWDIQTIEDEILKVRLLDLMEERELCFVLTEKAKLENDWYALAFSYTFLSDYYLACKDNNNTIRFLERAILLSSSKNYDDLLMKIYNFYGIFYNSICDEITALDYYLKSLDIAETRKDYIQMASTYNNIATLFDIKHNYQEAILYYEKSYHVLQYATNDTTFSKAVSLSNLCRCYYKLKNGKYLYDKILLFQEIIKDDSNEILNLLYLYCLSLNQVIEDKNDEFLKNMDQLLSIEKKIENKRIVHQVFTNICEELLDIQEYKYAKAYLDVLSQINQENDYTAKKELQILKVRYCKAIESMETQLKVFSEFFDIIISIEDIEQETASAGLAAKIELYKAKAKQNDLEKEKEKFETLMNLDDLTGLWNRRCFNHDIISETTLDADIIALAMIDIDYFKEYNDVYGHQLGDAILHEVGNVLNSVSSSDISAYRYGGDEFVILFINQSEEVVQKTIHEIKQGIQNKAIEHKGSRTNDYLTLTCGYAISFEKMKDVDELLNKADENLYEYKNARIERC